MLSESDFENKDRHEVVTPHNELKEWVVNYVGSKIATDENVTVEMIVEVFATEFPEFLMVVAEENFFRGYEQALGDLQEVKMEEESDGLERSAEPT
jgi:hypothetical protein